MLYLLYYYYTSLYLYSVAFSVFLSFHLFLSHRRTRNFSLKFVSFLILFLCKKKFNQKTHLCVCSICSHVLFVGQHLRLSVRQPRQSHRSQHRRLRGDANGRRKILLEKKNNALPWSGSSLPSSTPPNSAASWAPSEGWWAAPCPDPP